MPATSPARSRFVRRAALVAVATAGAATLVACQKPLPQVTFQSGSRSVLITPSTYCFTLERDSCRGEGSAIRLAAQPGSYINVSVPRSVALNAWIVTGNDVTDDGSVQAIDGAGSNVIRDNHHARVLVPDLGDAPYLLSVTEFRGSTPTGTWTVQVEPSS